MKFASISEEPLGPQRLILPRSGSEVTSWFYRIKSDIQCWEVRSEQN